MTNAPAPPSEPFRLLGELVRLGAPDRLRLLVAVALLAALGVFALARRRRALALAAGALAPRIAPTAGVARPAARLVFSLLALALLAVALARPQCGARREQTRRLGVDLVVALDVSRSMRARDVGPDRLARARLELEELLARSGGDRVGLVVFGGTAEIACPLTTDLEAFRMFLRGAGPDSIPDPGTDVGGALQRAREVLESAERAGRSRVVLLVTDGESHAPGAARAAAELAEAGIRVFALGVGGREGAPIPETDAAGTVTGYKKDGRGATVRSRLDEATLAAVASRGNGEVFEVARPDRGIERLRAALDALAKGEVSGPAAVAWEDRYAFLAFPALLLLLAALLLPEARRGRA
ncbi:MAG TPA: VWA domain-containing protein [Anaeromyxobacter sp.]|nr:VWA domain-containing protein [Anaeromyxobacter sp.]